jgi:O-antigen ligase
MSALPIAAALGCGILGVVLYFARNYVAEEATIWLGLPIGFCVVAAVALILQYRVAAVVALMFQFALVLCSAQRASTMAVLVCIPLLIWIGRRHFLTSLVLMVLSLGIFFAWLELMNPTLGGKLIPFMEKQFSAFLNPDMDPTGSWRLYGWRWEMNKVFSNPFWVLIGQGFGGYYEWYFTLTDDVIRTAPHNVYVQLWSKQGIVGLGLYLIAAFSFFKQGFQFLVQSRNEMRRSIMMILMLVIFGNMVNQIGGQFVVGSWVVMALGTILPRLWLAEQPSAAVHASAAPQMHSERAPMRGSFRPPQFAAQRSRL